jgi:CBS domain-containing protein
MLTRRDLARYLSEDSGGRRVGDVMHRTFETVGGSEPLNAVLGRLEKAPGSILLVMDGERLVGLLGLEEITNLLRIRRTEGRQHDVGGGKLRTTVT